MCGLYLAHMFELAGQPQNTVIAELGPGRGTLMQDMRSVWETLMPALACSPIHLVETSLALRRTQAALIAANDSAATTPEIHWHFSCDNLPDAPIFGIANEFFDALAVAQFVWRGSGAQGSWHHRLIGLQGVEFGFVTAQLSRTGRLQRHSTSRS